VDSNTKRSSVVAGILKSRQEESPEEPREASQAARQAIPAPMLDIRLADGCIRSFSYAYLTEMEFTPGDTLKLVFGDTTVIIDGQNLREMRDRIHMHKEDWVQEGTEAEGDLKPDGAAHVSRIDIERGEEERKERMHRENRRGQGIGR
jgi:hypothetical protein